MVIILEALATFAFHARSAFHQSVSSCAPARRVVGTNGRLTAGSLIAGQAFGTAAVFHGSITEQASAGGTVDIWKVRALGVGDAACLLISLDSANLATALDVCMPVHKPISGTAVVGIITCASRWLTARSLVRNLGTYRTSAMSGSMIRDESLASCAVGDSEGSASSIAIATGELVHRHGACCAAAQELRGI
jgi:hypothetical protein